MESSPHESFPCPSGLRYYGGWFFFILSFLMPAIALAVPALGLSGPLTVLIGGSLLIGGPEVAIILAIALWGRETFNYFWGHIKGWLRRLFPSHVSATRYYFGLVLNLTSFIPSYLLAYFPYWVSDSHRIPVLASADIIFVLSFFILGGEFWGKVRAIFVHSRAL